MMIRTTVALAMLAAILACGNGNNAANMTSTQGPPAIDGAKIFKVSCAICHGNDGKLGLNGSKDLSVSVLSLEDRIALITTGKGLMPAQGSILKADEIKAVAEYTLTLKK